MSNKKDLLIVAHINYTLITIFGTFKASNIQAVSKLTSLFKSITNFALNQFKLTTNKSLDMSSEEKDQLRDEMREDLPTFLHTAAINILLYLIRSNIILIDANAGSNSKNFIWNESRKNEMVENVILRV